MTRKMIVRWLVAIGLVSTCTTDVLACKETEEEQQRLVVLKPAVWHTVCDAAGRSVVRLRVDPRGMSRIELADEPQHKAWIPVLYDRAWDFREWHWWKGHPWGDSCRLRFHAKVDFFPEGIQQGDVALRYRVDGFDSVQQYLFPDTVDRAAPYWDVVISVHNATAGDVEEYAQFFACYTLVNGKDEPGGGRSHWFWDAGGDLQLWRDRGVHHLDGFLANQQAYFFRDGAIPHCPRADGKVIGTWRHPVLVSHATPRGWRAVIMLEEERTASVTQGMHGAAMDYIIFPGPQRHAFRQGERFSIHVRHYLIKSPELPSRNLLEKLWSQFRQATPAIHTLAQQRRKCYAADAADQQDNP